MGAGKSLRLFLRINACVCGLAIIAVFMPRAWMDVGHRLLGLGPIPPGPMFEYLARSTSFLYSFIGGLAWLLSCDTRRYALLIRYYAATYICLGILLLIFDRRMGFPWYWSASEGPLVIVVGSVMLGLSLASAPRNGEVR